MTDPGHVGSAVVAPPPFTSSAQAGVPGVCGSDRGRCRPPEALRLRRALDVEALCLRQPADSGAELVRRRLQRAGQLDDRRQPRLAPGPLQERDLGAMEIAEVAQLFLGDSGLGPGLA